MATYETEEEQLEALKKWWKENGRSIMLGLLLGVLIIAGWRGWQAYQTNRAESASTLYEQMESDARAGNKQGVEAAATLLRNNYSNTPYATIGTLYLAKQYVEAENYDGAVESLQWVIDNSSQENTVLTAKIRMARVLAAQNKLDDALKQLQSTVFPESYRHLVDEVSGDIYLQQGEVQKAREAYKRASLKNNSDVLQMKLDDLGTAKPEQG
ncbi:MAG: tetratricopeptide repeat protein [Gammaproteobacteria bacterium]|nr:tetratricopeptide repeat protein [Gammaproteobacteria bacterium]